MTDTAAGSTRSTPPGEGPDPARFEPPGPGTWMLDTTHHGRKPITWFMRQPNRMLEPGIATLAERYGLPIAGFRTAFVHGYLYGRPVPIGEGEKPRPVPPAPVMWLAARLHPGLRRQAKVAARAWRERRWRADVDGWYQRDRALRVERNRRLQAVDPARLDARSLADHLEEVVDNLMSGTRYGHESHGGDIIPTGDYLAHCQAWGIPPGEASALLQGASRASVESAEMLQPVAEAVVGAGRRPASLEEVSALSPAAAAALAAFRLDHGWRLVGSDDVDAPTLEERPDQLLAAVLAVRPGAHLVDTPDPAPVRARVPAGERELFDELLGEARYGLALRDDNVGVNWLWPAGLARRALLAAGPLLAERGALQEPGHALDLAGDEVVAVLREAGGPTAAEVARRHDERMAAMGFEPPDHLGPDEGPPPFHLLPAPLARAGRAIVTLLETMEGGAGSPTTGTGIGTGAFTGPAVVTDDPAEAMALAQPGAVLVTPCTNPSFNAVLASVGAVVTDQGGPMCHAAIMARELGIPAVVGASGATGRYRTGERLTVDPSAGTVQPA